MKKSKAQTLIVLLIVVLSVTSCVQRNARLSTISTSVVGDPNPGPINDWSLGRTPQRSLVPGIRTHILIEVDGGGIMGLTPAMVLADLEKQLQQKRHISKLNDIVSVYSGTSTGAIISGMLAAGVPAQTILDYYQGKGVEAFKSKGRRKLLNLIPELPLLNREYFQNSLFDMLTYSTIDQKVSPEDKKTITLGDLYSGPLLLIPAYDLCSERTLWFRNRGFNDEPLNTYYNKNVQLVDAISASALSAAFYFGSLRAPHVVWGELKPDGSSRLVRGAVFNDGGQGTQNCTLLATVLETIIRGWGSPSSKTDQVVIISLGCGNSFNRRSYPEATRLDDINQVLPFLIGGEARPESLVLQWRAAINLAAHNPNFHLYRLDFEPPAGSSAFSINDKQVSAYREKALSIINSSEYKKLVSDLSGAIVGDVGPAQKMNLPATSSQKNSLKGF